MPDYSEIFCTAVNEIVQQRIKDLGYDITKDCTIISTKNKSKNEYMVSDGSSSFKAYAAEGCVYALGDQVLVTIPQGDYSQQKTILNKIVNNESSPIGYVSPLESFIKGSDNVITVTGSYGIIANGDKNNIMKLITTITPKDNRPYVGFTNIALAAEFMTMLDNMGVTTGEYGIKLLVYHDSGVSECTFSASEMLGNPYSFNSYFYQETVFTLPDNINQISKIEVYLYQDGTFTIDGTILEPSLIDNIFVKNLQLWLGFVNTIVNSEMVKIATENLEYDTSNAFGTAWAMVDLTWMHSLGEGAFEAINPLNWNQYKDKCAIRWYQYSLGCEESETDEFGGKNWKLLSSSDDNDDNPFWAFISLSANKMVERVKVITFYKTYPLQNDPTYEVMQHYQSNILEFENITQATAGGSIADAQNTDELSLYFEDGSGGNYYQYDQNGCLINPQSEGGSKIRSVALYVHGEKVDEAWDGYNSIDWIKWEMPSNSKNTMLIAKESLHNPNENLIKEPLQPIEFGEIGTFTYTCTVSEISDAVAAMKVVLLTADEIDETGNNWKVASSQTISIIPGEEQELTIAATLSIRQAYKYLKVNYIFFDKDQKEISIPNDSKMVVKDETLKLNSIFHSCTKDKEKGISFNYAIADLWLPDRNNNIIKCTVSRNGTQYVLTETLRFGPKGSSGTQYTFLLEMLEGKNALTIGGDLTVEAILLNGNGQRINFTGDEEKEIKWQLINTPSEQELISYSELEGKKTITLTSSGQTPEDGQYYTILQASYKYKIPDEFSGTAPMLYAFLPIPLKTSDCIGMQGATQVIYNHLGSPSQNFTPYIAFTENNEDLIDWKLSQDLYNPNPVSLAEAASIKFSYMLSPSPMYSKNKAGDIIADQICVYCEDKWWQPILVMQSHYDFAMLNSWDGNLTIDNENGTILSTMLGAGKKNTNNEFSGVLIGDVQGGTGLETTTPLTGVYGFQDGRITYGLMENGNAFFGSQDSGRIEFDGTSGIIRSAGWEKNSDEEWQLQEGSTGTLIDLDDGEFLIQGSDNSYIYFTKGDLQISVKGDNMLSDGKTLNSYINATGKADFYCNITGAELGSMQKIYDIELPLNSSDITSEALSNKTLDLLFTTGSADRAEIWFKIKSQSGHFISIHDKEKFPFVVGTSITSSDNPFTWSPNDIIRVRYTNSTIDINGEEYPGYFLLVDYVGSYSLFAASLDTMVAQVGGDTSTFGWSLKSDGFKLYGGNQDNPVFICNHQGITIGGNGLIQSQNYNVSNGIINEGMSISLSDGSISTAGLGISDGKNSLLLDKTNGISVIVDNNKTVFQAGVDGVALATSNYAYIPGEGTSYYCQRMRVTRNTGGALNIRSGPGSTYTVIGTHTFYENSYVYFKLKNNASGAGLDTNNGWWPIFVYYDGSEYLPYTSEKALPTEAPPKVGYVYRSGTLTADLFDSGTAYGVTASSATVKGAKLNFSSIDTENFLSFCGGENKYLKLGGDTDYALQIGSFKVKWDGTVEGA